MTDSVPAAIRGSIGTIFQINICGFILVAELINYAFHPDASDTNLHEPEWAWKTQFAFSALPGLVLFILSFIMHESPVYLAALDEQSRGALYGTVEETKMDSVASENGDVPSPASAIVPATVEKEGWGVLFSMKNIKW